MTDTSPRPQGVQKKHCDICAHRKACPKMVGIPYCYGSGDPLPAELRDALDKLEIDARLVLNSQKKSSDNVAGAQEDASADRT